MLKTIFFERYRKDGSRASKGVKVGLFDCDFCHKEFEIRSNLRVREKLRSKHQFCTHACYSNWRASSTELIALLRKASVQGRQTVKERYGNPMNAPGAREKVSAGVRETNQKSKEETGYTKSQLTALARYGVTCTFQLPHLRKKANSLAAKQKRAATVAANGGSNTSKLEDLYHEALIGIFGAEQVLRQVIDPVRRKWVFDFYIIPIHTFVQFDGAYWHGLTRTREQLENPITKRDQVITKKWHTDREQDETYRKRGIHLVRVTDLQFKKGIVLP